VAISITTIPAAAYLGSAAGARETVRASGALAVLGVNIAVLVLPGTLPLACGCPKLCTQPVTCPFVRGRRPGMIR